MLLVSALPVKFTGTDSFATKSSAFAKGKGNKGNGGGKGKNKGDGDGNGGRKNKDADETEDGGKGDDGDPGEAVDFQDEGFIPRKHVKIPAHFGREKDNEPDFLDHTQKEEHLRDGLGFSDKIDLKAFKKDIGNTDEYLKLLNPGASHTEGHISEGEGPASAKNAKENLSHDGLGFNDRLDLKSVKKGPEAGDPVHLLNADAANKGDGRNPVGEHQAQVKDDSLSADQKAQIETLKAQKTELQGQITDLKDARKDATTKEEKKALQAEIKEQRQELKETKQAIKAVKGEEESLAATEAGRNGSGSGIQPIRAGSYATKEVLSLGLSPSGIGRVRELGFTMSDPGLEQEDKALLTLTVPDRMDALSAIRLLRRELPRESFYLNRLYRPYQPAMKTETEKGEQADRGAQKCLGDRCYSKTAIRWKDDFTRCTQNISVGVIDTDIDLKHPTFAGQKITQQAFLSDGKRPSPNWHGTGILALLAGRPDSGTPGLIPEAKFYVASIFFSGDGGEAVTDTVSLLKSLDWMSASGAKLVNMSFSGPQDDLVQARLKGLRTQGFVFTAAAGNEGPAAQPAYPAAYPEVVAVTAVAKDLHVYPSANRGKQIDVAAPGVDIWTALPNAREGYRTGTSFATPFATAVLALQKPDVLVEPKDELLDHLKTVELGPQGRNPIYGRGLVQAPSECPNITGPVSKLAPVIGSVQR